MKKISAIILTLVMLFTVSACNIKDVTKMASIGDDAVTKGEFNYYLMMAKSQAMSAASQSGDTLSSEEDWNTVKIGDKTAAEYVMDTVKDSVKKVLVLKAKALKDGEKLTDEDLETVKTQRNSFIEQLGGRYNYEQAIAEYGFTLEDVEKVIKDQILAQKASDKYLSADKDNETLQVSDEEAQAKYESDYVMAKHILFMPEEETEAEESEGAKEEETATQEASPEKMEAAKAQAEDVIKQLDGGADFDTLMKTYSKDTDADGNPNGDNGAYVFTKGEMVSAFETAAFELEVGKYTKEPVETEYGYHIIMRLPLPTQGEQYDNAIQKIKTALSEDKIDEIIDSWAEEFGFTFNEKAISRVKM